VEFFRRRWHDAAGDRVVSRVHAHAQKKLFRHAPAAGLIRALAGSTYIGSEARAKQMVFRFGAQGWLGIHLGMTGELFAAPAGYRPARHDHLCLEMDNDQFLVFRDPRMFGGVRWHVGSEEPDWWAGIAPDLLSARFTRPVLAAFLARRRRAPLKAVLLMQERFPGIGNWMADEILWRAGIHPARLAGSLADPEQRRLYREIRQVCRLALKHIAGLGGQLPPDLNVSIPDTWLFNHRWENGGRCPRTGGLLVREEIGGRTTCWSPGRQSL
jgi:formamidopyrimidine-DNA glycosylase